MNNLVSTISQDTHTAMREDRLDAYTQQLTDKNNTDNTRLKFRLIQEIANSLNITRQGDVTFTSIPDNVSFTISDDGTQIIISLTYTLKIKYPPIFETDSTFDLDVTETATINAVFV